MAAADERTYRLLGALARPRRAVRRRVALRWRRRLAVTVGGVVGTRLRAAVSGVAPIGVTTFPWAVLAVNLTGSLLLGYLLTRLQAAAVVGIRVAEARA